MCASRHSTLRKSVAIASVLCWLLVLFGRTGAPAGSVAAGKAQLRAATFNIRYDNTADGAHAWSERRERVIALIESLDADIVGLQEVLPAQMEYLREHLPHYTIRGVGRSDGRSKGEASPIAYRTKRFDEIDFGTRWLSETPDRPSRGWDAALPRVATHLRLRDRVSSHEILVIATHFDHRGAKAREESAKLLATLLADEPRVLLLGDFNAEPESKPHAILTGTLTDAAGDNDDPTWTGFDGVPDPGRRIDWILVRGFRVAGYRVHDWSNPERPESDHLLVIANLMLTD